jgi:hypothetical protein
MTDVARIHPERAALTRSAELDVSQAEGFLLELDGRTQGADLPRAMYLLGLAEAHIANLVELVRGLTA